MVAVVVVVDTEDAHVPGYVAVIGDVSLDVIEVAAVAVLRLYCGEWVISCERSMMLDAQRRADKKCGLKWRERLDR